MKRHHARKVAWLGAALLLGCALSACGPRHASDTSTAPPAATSAPVDTGGAGPSGSPSPSSSASPTASGPASPDPVASELNQINQLINDIDNSVQSSDSSQQGGE